MYAIERFNLSSAQAAVLNSWWNAVFRKLFNYNKWDSVRELIFLLDRMDLNHLILVKRALFNKRNFVPNPYQGRLRHIDVGEASPTKKLGGLRILH